MITNSLPGFPYVWTNFGVPIRAKGDNQRSHDMHTALCAYAEGQPDPQDWWQCSARSSADASGHPAANPSEPGIKTSNSRVPRTPQASGAKLEDTALAIYFALDSSLGKIEASKLRVCLRCLH